MKARLLTVVATIILCLTTAYSQTQPPHRRISQVPQARRKLRQTMPVLPTTRRPTLPLSQSPWAANRHCHLKKRIRCDLLAFAKPPVIDGKLDDEVWKGAVVLKDFYQTQPGDNLAPSKPTEVMLGMTRDFSMSPFIALTNLTKCAQLFPSETTFLTMTMWAFCSTPLTTNAKLMSLISTHLASRLTASGPKEWAKTLVSTLCLSRKEW